jgi:hypothetical protein
MGVFFNQATAIVITLSLISIASGIEQRVNDIINMQKSIHSSLGQYSIPEISSHFKPEFRRLDVYGDLADTLMFQYELRLLDLQISINHAKKMQGVIEYLNNTDVQQQNRMVGQHY